MKKKLTVEGFLIRYFNFLPISTANCSMTVSTPAEDVCKHEGEEDLKTQFLEKVAVLLYVFTFVISPLVCIAVAVFVAFTPILWCVAFPYLVWFAYDFHVPRRGSRSSAIFRNYWLWKYLAGYFPMKLVKTADLPADRNYIIGVHPHGIIGFATFVTFVTEGTNFSQLFPGITRFPITLPMQFWFPIRREVLTLTGTISSDKEAIEYVLDRPGKGYAVAIVPGGAAEALDSHPDTYDLTLKNRKGFVRLAIKHGANLVPSYHFGENKIYSQVPNPPGSRLRKFQEQLKKWTGATIPIFYGRGVVSNIIGLMPYRKEIVTVVGAPVRVKENAHPSEEEVDEVHAEYCRQLTNLFDEHKTKHGISEETKLEFV